MRNEGNASGSLTRGAGMAVVFQEMVKEGAYPLFQAAKSPLPVRMIPRLSGHGNVAGPVPSAWSGREIWHEYACRRHRWNAGALLQVLL